MSLARSSDFRYSLHIRPFQSGFLVSSPVLPQSASLLDLRPGETGVIDSLELPDQVQQMLLRFGFVAGAEVRFSRSAPLGDPLLYTIEGTDVALRAETARRILLLPRDPADGQGECR